MGDDVRHELADHQHASSTTSSLRPHTLNDCWSR
jgi:hypothetical protein